MFETIIFYFFCLNTHLLTSFVDFQISNSWTPMHLTRQKALAQAHSSVPPAQSPIAGTRDSIGTENTSATKSRDSSVPIAFTLAGTGRTFTATSTPNTRDAKSLCSISTNLRH